MFLISYVIQKTHNHSIPSQKVNSDSCFNRQSRIQLLFIIFMIQVVGGLISGPPLTIMHFQPNQFEVMRVNLVLSNDTGLLTYSASQSVQPSRNAFVKGWHCQVCMRDFQLMIQQANSDEQILSVWRSQSASICTVTVDQIKKSRFTSITLNIIFYGKKIVQNKQFHTFFTTSSTSSGNCLVDGRTTRQSSTCQRDINSLNLPSTNYKIFTYFVKVNRKTPLATSPKPFYQIQVKFVSVSAIEFKLTFQYLQCTYWQSLSIFIHQKLFDTTQRQPLMFSQVSINHSDNPTSPFPFTIPFPHYISYSNFFMGISSYKGFDYSLTIEENNPADTLMQGVSNHIGNSVGFFSFGFYGYSQLCPVHLTMPCQKCPQYCKTCHVWPNFHCFQCNTNFTLSQPDKLSCTCSQTIIGQFCTSITFGCMVPTIDSITGHISCLSCDFTDKLTLIGNYCNCIQGYSFDLNNSCKSICGDGLIVDQQQCDDNNTQPGDGCSSDCKYEAGVEIDFSTNPPGIKSELILKYKVEKILKIPGQNSARIYLTLSNNRNLPFEVKKQQFDLAMTNIKLKVKLQTPPYEEVQLSNFVLAEVNQNKIIIELQYEFDLENLQASIFLDYQNTQYKNQTQIIDFKMNADNYALKVSKNQAVYKTFGGFMLAIIILNVICLLIGFFTSKFIGLQSILTCQLIYYSQLMIFDISRWPSGFIFLTSMKYSTGFNEFFHFTNYIRVSTMTKKMYSLQLKKLLIENFNLSFVILLLVFICLFASSIIRKKRQIMISKQLKVMKQDKVDYQKFGKISAIQLSRFDKINEITFWIANQTSLWLLLPLLSSISADFLIPNNQFNFFDDSDRNNFLIQIRGLIFFVSLFMIFCILLNNFKNVWLSKSSEKQLMQRVEEIRYKNLLFIYLFLTGIIIFFFSSKKSGPIFSSSVVLGLHFMFFVALIRISPYKQSLKVHTVSLLINNGILMVFLIVINLLNYIENLDEIVVLGLGFFLTGGGGLSLMLSYIRFYYELRYGRALQEQLMNEKEHQRLKKEKQKQMILKKNEQIFIKDANLRITERQRLLEENKYLYQNMIKEDQKIDYFQWLQMRDWDQKKKDKQFYKHFDEKPLYYLKTDNPQRYKQAIEKLENKKSEQEMKREAKMNDPEYQQAVSRLRKQMHAINDRKPHSKKDK